MSANRDLKGSFQGSQEAAEGRQQAVNFDQLVVALSLNGDETLRGDHSQ
jgi:hypothetical protein